MHIYVASSWRNTYYPEVVQALRDAGHEVYDFITELRKFGSKLEVLDQLRSVRISSMRLRI